LEESGNQNIQDSVIGWCSPVRGSNTCQNVGEPLAQRRSYVKCGEIHSRLLVLLPIEWGFASWKIELASTKQIANRLLKKRPPAWNLMIRWLGIFDFKPVDFLPSSGGEFNGIKSQPSLGSALVGSMYILDRNQALTASKRTVSLTKFGVLKSLRDNGKSVIVVEHEKSHERLADQIIWHRTRRWVNGANCLFQGTIVKNWMTSGQNLHCKNTFAGRQIFKKDGKAAKWKDPDRPKVRGKITWKNWR